MRTNSMNPQNNVIRCSSRNPHKSTVGTRIHGQSPPTGCKWEFTYHRLNTFFFCFIDCQTDTDYFRVRVGPFDNRSSAQQLRDRLDAEGKGNGRVVAAE